MQLPSAMKCTLIILLIYLVKDTVGWRFYYSNNTMNWTQARRWCQENYKDMVVIQNQAENDYLVSLLPDRTASPYYWIGVTKTHISDPWTWVGNNSTWIGNDSWAADEPNNNHSTEFCVEIYVNNGQNRGKWNDEKCSNLKYTACYQAECSNESCNGGKCRETINNITCICEPGFGGDRCQEVVGCSPLSQLDNGYVNCSQESHSINSSCHFGCSSGFLVLGSLEVFCSSDGVWSGPRPVCASYKLALMAVAGCGAFSVLCWICICCLKYKRRKELAQSREPEEERCPTEENQG